MAVYERMLADGMQPTTGTYTGLITAWGKNGKARRDGFPASGSCREPFKIAGPTHETWHTGTTNGSPLWHQAPAWQRGAHDHALCVAPSNAIT